MLVALAAAACHRGVPVSFAPQPAKVIPAGGPRNVAAQVRILGQHFYVRGVQSLSAHGGVSIDDGYGAILDGVALQGVVRVSDTELRAVVPRGLPAGPHDLTVVAPDGLSGALAPGWLASDLPPAQLQVASALAARVSTGQSFTVALAVRNSGGATARQVVPSALQLAGTGAATVPSGMPAAQDIPGGESRTFIWTLIAAQAGTLSVSSGAAGVDEVSQMAIAGAPAAAQSLIQQRSALEAAAQPPAQPVVSAGQSVGLTLIVTNTGSAAALSVSFPPPQMAGPALELVSAPAPQDVPGAMGSRSFTWIYRAAQPGDATPLETGGAGTDENDALPVAVPAASWPRTTVQVPAQISGSPGAAPAQVSVGQSFAASLVVANAGQAAAASVVPTLQQSGSGAVAVVAAPAGSDVPGGGSANFGWTLRGTAAGTVSLSLGAGGSDANSGAAIQAAAVSAGPVVVQTPPQLTGSAAVSPAQASTGQPIQLRLDVTNAGQATAAAVLPGAPIAGGPGARLLQPPAAQDVPGGATRTFLWSYAIDVAGPVQFSVSGSGTDQNSGSPVPLPSATSNAVTISKAAFLQASTTLDRTQVSVGQDLVLRVDVTNAGQVDALGVACTATMSGSGAATVVGAPAAQDVPAQSTRTFQWTFHTTGAGSLDFAISASGTDKLSSANVSTSAKAGPVLVQAPAALLSGIAATPSTANSGQAITVSLTVKNPGGASATNVTPALTVGGAGATLVSGPAPASATIAGGAAQAFTWTYRGAGLGTASFSGSASGTDANSGQTVAASTPAPASVVVQAPAALAGALSVSAQSVNVGQAFTATLAVSNSGDSAANAVSPSTPVLAGSGGATLTGVTPSSATVPGHGGQSFVFAYTGSAPGTVTLSSSASGTDATDGNPVASAPATSTAVTVQTPSAISAVLSIPRNLPLGDSFTAALTVTNSGDAPVSSLAPGPPVISAASTGAATLGSGPSPGTPVTLPGHSDQTFTWVFSATGEGTLQLSAQAAGTDANDGTPRSASASSAVAPIAEVVQVAANPFGDNTAFSFLASFSGQLWLGPGASGGGAVRMNADGSAAQPVPWRLEHGSGAKNTYYQAVPAPTIGYKGCASNTAQCGPDNESGRALFFSGVVAGTEWLGLAGAHVNAGTDYARFTYLTNAGFPLASGGATDFAYADLSNNLSSSTKSLSAAAVFHDRVYLGFHDGSAQSPVLEALTSMPSLPGSTPTGNSLLDMGASNMPGIGGGLGAMIDSMAVFGASPSDALYLANANGFTRSTSTTPGQCQVLILILLCPDWTDATPNALAYTLKSSLTTAKTSDLEPADRAVPSMVGFGGRFFAARNTTTGPQLWSCDPTRGGSATQCDPGDWSLLAPNSNGDARLSQFNDASNAAVTLLAATSQHLYVGFNNATRGVVVYRTANPAAAGVSDFTGRLGCAATGNGCPGLGRDGLGDGMTRIYDGKAFGFGGTDHLYLAVGTGTSPVRIYRVAH